VFVGVAYSRHIVQIYSYHGGDAIRQHLEVYTYQVVCWCLSSHYLLVLVTCNFCQSFTDWCSCWWCQWSCIFSTQ